MITFTHTTADGHRAAPIEDEPLLWLVEVIKPGREHPGLYNVFELHHWDVKITDVRAGVDGLADRYHTPGTVRRCYKRDGWAFSGWLVEYAQNPHDPYARREDAINGLLLAIAQRRREREERAARD